ncbi:Cytochrome c oxidase assembly protein cox15 [Boothiomyces macroporosus]|uniref:Cytochrome c oxidase assembly protein cox15 n=1 Tax=Boothiomyces macroporosus TaxID=261099 RepID=A0AAD5UKH3_9FUNG|nr:Cytochrome c oxidase assembly protein cox15 [Boothiomyces macroporosus]
MHNSFLHVDVQDSNHPVFIEKAVADAVANQSHLTIILGYKPVSFHHTQIVLHEIYDIANKVSWDLEDPTFQVDVVIDSIAGQLPQPDLEYVGSVQRYNSKTKKLDALTGQLKHYKEYQLPKPSATEENLKYYPNVALGGTFDRLHAGHKILLSMAVLICNKRLICGVTDFKPEVLKKKKYYEYIQPLDERLDLVKAFLSKFKPGVVLDVVAIQDDYGPTRTDPDIQAIVGSMETKRGFESKWNEVFSPRKLSTTIEIKKPEELKAETKFEKTEENEPSKRIVAYWYLTSAFLVFGIVILGGVTRLTESGLSIVEWNLIKGMKPPINEEEWIEEFEKYKQFPEYKLLNHNISLDEFKTIFYFEWAHRMWGRAIGLFFIIPGLYFASRGYMTKKIRARSLLVATMIGSQGVLGWFMVKSGLGDDIIENKQVPRVNHFWLSAHLASAFVIYMTMLTTGFEILKQNEFKNMSPFLKEVRHTKLKWFSVVVAGFIFATAISGAWVAGLDAGLIYNEFPYMGEGFVPSDMWAYSTKSFQNPAPMEWWENLIKNPSAVQFNHRVLAVTTASLVTTLFLASKTIRTSRHTRIASNLMMAVCAIQVGLGISTLIYFVPIPLAAAHQGGSLTLLTVAMWLIHTLRVIR